MKYITALRTAVITAATTTQVKAHDRDLVAAKEHPGHARAVESHRECRQGSLWRFDQPALG